MNQTVFLKTISNISSFSPSLMMLSNWELLEKARTHQRAARNTKAEPADAFLITPDSTGLTSGFTSVVHLSGKKDKTGLIAALKKGNLHGQGRPTSEREVMQVFHTQSYHSPTLRVLDGSHTSERLPGGVPLIDHLAARVIDSPDWNGLMPVIEDLRTARLPEGRGLDNYRELTLGRSSPEEWAEATQFLKDRLAEDLDSPFPFCAADSESVQVSVNWSKGLKETVEDSLLRHLEDYRKDGHKDRVFTVFPDRRTPSGTKAELPVRFMVGGRDWQVHLRLPTESRQDHHSILMALELDTVLPPEADAFLRNLPCLVGVGITKDVVSWARFLRVVCGSTAIQDLPGTIELERLMRAARINDSSSSIFHLNWWIFGTILPKHDASMGDGAWNKKLEELPRSLKMYLCCDLEQVSKLATILAMIWAIQTFPDCTIVKSATLMDEAGFLNWVQTRAFPALFAGWEAVETDRAGCWEYVRGPRQWEPQTSVERLVDHLNPPTRQTYSEIWNAPAWPAITGGGCRFLHQARSAAVGMLDQLHLLDPDVWPNHDTANADRRVFWTFSVPSDMALAPCHEPVDSPFLCPLPGYESRLPVDPFDWASGECLGLARKAWGAGDRALILMHIRLNIDNATSVLRFAEERKTAFRKMLRGSRVVKMVQEVRDMLGYLNKTIDRPQGWKDPYDMEGYLGYRERKIESHVKRKLEDCVSFCDPEEKVMRIAEDVLGRGAEGLPTRTAYAAQLYRIATLRNPANPTKTKDTDNVLTPEEGVDSSFGPALLAEIGNLTLGESQEDGLTKKVCNLKLTDNVSVPAGSDNLKAAELSELGMQEKVASGCVRISLAGLAVEVYPITEEMEETVRCSMSRPPNTPLGQAQSFAFTVADAHTLRPREWLNDAVISGYMRLLQRRASSERSLRIEVVETFFYPVLVEKKYEGVKNHTRKRDIFAADLFLVPLNFQNLHWALGVVEMSTGRVAVYDSANVSRRSRTVCATLLDYLQREHQERKGEPLPSKFHAVIPDDVPQQVGTWDCGVFVCRFAEALTRKARMDFNQDDMPHFRRLILWELISASLLPPRDLVNELLGSCDEANPMEVVDESLLDQLS